MSLVGNVGNAVFSSAVGYMYDFTGGYTATLVMFGVMTVVLAGLVVFVYARKQAAPAA
jgi:nitrate/nitrite transporter NarK